MERLTATWFIAGDLVYLVTADDSVYLKTTWDMWDDIEAFDLLDDLGAILEYSDAEEAPFSEDSDMDIIVDPAIAFEPTPTF